ncbi:unnamed protein product [Blepharisma stoltei]|uniref:Uncharacterized protein n=1 Tax=Blepharisma stoltei TaxID=1481888 RepID=A0AAU9JGZ3_9CILI|nr:unnamed protein product [Blepharisma stoltei]
MGCAHSSRDKEVRIVKRSTIYKPIVLQPVNQNMLYISRRFSTALKSIDETKTRIGTEDTENKLVYS